MEQRFYQSGPNIGKPIQEYPKCLYKLSGDETLTRIVKNEEEHILAEQAGFLAMRGGKFVAITAPAADPAPTATAKESGKAKGK